MLPSSEETVERLPDAAARRLSNQIARAYRGTYGARTGLKTIVSSVARQMLRGGASPDAVTRLLTHYVLNHADAANGEPRSIITGKLHSTTLVELTEQCVADVALETAPG